MLTGWFCRLVVSRPAARCAAARAGLRASPHMARAVARHCRELPSLFNGLSLTEQLILQLLSEASRTAGEIFAILMRKREPLPWLGGSSITPGQPARRWDEATATPVLR